MQNKRSYFVTSRRLSPHPIHIEMKTPGKKKEKKWQTNQEKGKQTKKKTQIKKHKSIKQAKKKKQKQQHQ